MRRAVPDAPNQEDNPQVLMVDEDPQAIVLAVVAVVLRDEAGTLGHELVKVVGHGGRVAKGKITTPAPEEQVEAFHDLFDFAQQPSSVGMRPDVTGTI